MKSSGCMTCHAIDKKKLSTSFKDVAKKYKGKAGAEEQLIKHVTLKPMVDVDGTKTEHKALKTSDPAEVRNVVQWILAQ
jgi:cytochrome c